MIYNGGFPPLMIYAALCASMICQAYGLDKNFDKPTLVEIFGGDGRTRTYDLFHVKEAL